MREQEPTTEPAGPSLHSKAADRLDGFERGVVFRVARGFFLSMAALGVLALLAGVGSFGLGLWRPALPPPQEPPAVKEPGPLTLEVVERWRREQEPPAQAAPAVTVTSLRPTPAAEAPDPERQAREELERLLGQLKQLFPGPEYTWEDVYDVRCKLQTSFGCLETDRRLQKAGVLRGLREALEGVPRREALEVLRVMVAVLGQAEVSRRGRLLAAVVGAHRQRQEAYQQEQRARAQAIEEAQQRHQREVTRQEEGQERLRQAGLYGAGGGLALLVLVSLFLTHFAMERHLRLLRASRG